MPMWPNLAADQSILLYYNLNYLATWFFISLIRYFYHVANLAT